LLNINNDTVTIPAIRETYGSSFWSVNWIVCLDDNGDYKLIPMLDYDAVLGTPNAPTRLFTAVDVISSTSYILPASSFADLVNNRKDLTPLYVVSTTTVGTITPTVSITIKDVRKFIYKSDWSERPTLAVGIENADFRSLEALTMWFNYNSSYNNTVNVRGTISSFTSPMTFTTRSRFYGDGLAAFSVSSTLSITNIEFNSITFTVNATMTLTSVDFNSITFGGTANLTSTTSNFNKCTFNVPAGASLVFNSSNLDNVTFNLNGGATLSFGNSHVTNCTINCSSGASTINITGVNSNIINNTFTFNSASNTLNFTGRASGNKFNWNAISNVINVSGDIDLIANHFLSTTSIPISYFLNIADGTNGIISDNLFFRLNNVISAYIVGPASLTSGVVTITNNFFDSSTIDGTNQNLISNLPLTWIYANNLNTPHRLNVRRITAGGTYNVAITDHVLALEHTSAITINLPTISASPAGRTLIIKDVLGRADSFPITLHRAVSTENIENIVADYVTKNPYGSITIVINSTGWTIL